MSLSAVDIYEWFHGQVKDVILDSLNFDVVMGYPNWDNPDCVPPVACIQYYSDKPVEAVSRIGQQVNLREIVFQLGIFAGDEDELLGACDAVSSWFKSVSPAVNGEQILLSRPSGKRLIPQTNNEKESNAFVYNVTITTNV